MESTQGLCKDKHMVMKALGAIGKYEPKYSFELLVRISST